MAVVNANILNSERTQIVTPALADALDVCPGQYQTRDQVRTTQSGEKLGFGNAGTYTAGISSPGSGQVLIEDGSGNAATSLSASDIIQATNGGQWVQGYNTELITLNTGGTTTDSSANLLPAGAVIAAVVARVTTTIATATDWKLGDATTAGRFSAANSTLTAGTTQIGLVHVDVSGAGGPRQTSAAKLRITTTGTPSAGAIRVTVFYSQFVAPTS
jgi:hypothetical protein